MLYKIGDVAKILGVSADTLRYYEKRGLIQPVKGSENDYRYYDFWDINLLLACLRLRAFDFSIGQVADILQVQDHHLLDPIFEKREESYRSAIQQLQMLLQCCRQYRADLDRIDRCLDRCEIAVRPEYVCFLNRYTETFDNAPELQRLSREWLDMLPFARRYFEIAQADLLSQDSSNYSWGMGLPYQDAQLLGVPLQKPLRHMPACKAIHTIFRAGNGEFAPARLRYLTEYAQTQRLNLCGPVSGILLAEVREGARFSGYFEAWLPVE